MPTYAVGQPAIEHEGRKRKPKKEIDHLVVRHAENGGHIVEHHHTSMEHEPEHHAFGPSEGEDMLAHVAHHMKISLDEPVEESEQPAEDRAEEEES